jgi:hypothetical protein
MPLRSAVALLAVVPVVLLAPSGCRGRQPARTPEAVAQAFVDAMAKGDTSQAAGLWDYVSEARKQNQDWDEIPSGQRSQIIAKQREAKAGELGAVKAYFGAGMKAEQAQVIGTTATVGVPGGPQGALSLELEQTDGRWGVTGLTASVPQQ